MRSPTATAPAGPTGVPAIAAVAYAVAGWPVLPLHHPDGDGRCSCAHPACPSPGKHPRYTERGGFEHGVHDASTDPARVAGWWERWPDANVGVRTGRLLVLDVDGLHGAQALQELEAAHEPLPATRRVRSGHGEHLYFHAAEHEVGCSVGRLGAGLDVRGRGGYIVAPPSRHATGCHYRWLNTHRPAPLPAWLAELLEPPQPPRQPLPELVATGARKRADRYLRAALEAELTQVARAQP